MTALERRGRRFEGATRDFQRLITGCHTLLYRLSGGAIGASLGGIPILLLSTLGRRTGRLHITPLTYLQDGERYVLVASNGGTPGSPGWYHNLMATRSALVQVGAHTFVAEAVPVDAERARLWPLVNRVYPGYEQYQKLTDREIPLIALYGNDER